MRTDCKTFLEDAPCFGVAHATHRSRAGTLLALALLAGGLVACGTDAATPGTGGTGGTGTNPPPPGAEPALILNEVMAKNQGSWIDEAGETGDWIELLAVGDEPVDPSHYFLEDSGGERVQLQGPLLPPGATRLLWADDGAERGAIHLPFKLDADGDRLLLSTAGGEIVDDVELPALAADEAFARFPDGGSWTPCRYASPDHANGEGCTPPPPPSLDDHVEFESFELPDPYPPTRDGLSVSALSLRPAPGGSAFVELKNDGSTAIDLSNYALWLASHAPDRPWPAAGEGQAVLLPATTLAPGQRATATVSPPALALLEAANHEGVASLYELSSLDPVDRVDFMSWPEGAELSRAEPESSRLVYCEARGPGSSQPCEPLSSRPVGERLRHLRTPGDYPALAEGETRLGIQSVKFVVDLQADGLVHLLSASRWPLHYTFVRERIYLERALDRCDPTENAEFYQGWSAFSVDEYFQVEGRRFLLGTLSHHGGADLKSVEYTFGDVISGAQMREGYYRVLPHLHAPRQWALRPQDDTQVGKVRSVEGSVPLLNPSAPFEGVTYQPLTEGVAYGYLRFVPSAELPAATLGRDVIVITDDVPNDIAFVGGLITEAFQTPLAHVNVLSQSRGTPNASLVGARERLADWIGQLVRVEVHATELRVDAASLEDARAHWEQSAGSGPPVSPRLDTSLRGVQPLSEHGLDSLPAIGAKAAQLAELGRDLLPFCGSSALPIVTPESAFAIPVVHSLEHYEASGALDELRRLRSDPSFLDDPAARASGLVEVRRRILEHPVESSLLAAVETAVSSRHGTERVRFRSSSNTEDLPGFNGAGLYTSSSAEAGSEQRSVQDALRTVWASLYNARAFDERMNAGIDEDGVAMGVLVHEAYRNEQANGVAVSRNVLEPLRGDIYYLNAQAGEASVTNPAPGVGTEQLVYRWYRQPPVLYQSESSLLSALGGNRSRVLDLQEVEDLSCALRSVHDRFAVLLDPDGADPHFAMEVEFKFVGSERQLVIKQARPYSFPGVSTFGDCREL